MADQKRYFVVQLPSPGELLRLVGRGDRIVKGFREAEKFPSFEVADQAARLLGLKDFAVVEVSKRWAPL